VDEEQPMPVSTAASPMLKATIRSML
jgi:hypothetical protein